jgi:hypothetical protein
MTPLPFSTSPSVRAGFGVHRAARLGTREHASHREIPPWTTAGWSRILRGAIRTSGTTPHPDARRLTMRARFTFFPILGLAALALAACDAPVAPPDPPAAAALRTPGPGARVLGTDHYFQALAERVPGFGGFYFDAEGDLHAWLTDLRGEAAARAALGQVLRERALERGEGGGAPRIHLHRGAYDFARLAEWHARAGDVLSVPGVLMTDADERRNRVMIGVESPEAAERARAAAVRLGVPAGALVVDVVEPVLPAVTLQDRVRPIPGGYEIRWANNLYCTLGFNAVALQSFIGFVTASHCTHDQAGTQSITTYYQNNTLAPGDQIGSELLDPPYFTGGSCPANRRCRYSDAAFAIYDMLLSVNVPIGKVARAFPGSITVDPMVPTFQIVAEDTLPFVGQTLFKVGRTTGRTTGPVAQTCVNVLLFQTNIVLLCQDRVSAGVAPGDSGSPVLRGTSSTRLMGTVWGRNADGTQFTFSRINLIERDLGALQTF